MSAMESDSDSERSHSSIDSGRSHDSASGRARSAPSVSLARRNIEGAAGDRHDGEQHDDARRFSGQILPDDIDELDLFDHDAPPPGQGRRLGGSTSADESESDLEEDDEEQASDIDIDLDGLSDSSDDIGALRALPEGDAYHGNPYGAGADSGGGDHGGGSEAGTYDGRGKKSTYLERIDYRWLCNSLRVQQRTDTAKHLLGVHLYKQQMRSAQSSISRGDSIQQRQDLSGRPRKRRRRNDSDDSDEDDRDDDHEVAGEEGRKKVRSGWTAWPLPPAWLRHAGPDARRELRMEVAATVEALCYRRLRAAGLEATDEELDPAVLSPLAARIMAKVDIVLSALLAARRRQARRGKQAAKNLARMTVHDLVTAVDCTRVLASPSKGLQRTEGEPDPGRRFRHRCIRLLHEHIDEPIAPLQASAGPSLEADYLTDLGKRDVSGRRFEIIERPTLDAAAAAKAALSSATPVDVDAQAEGGDAAAAQGKTETVLRIYDKAGRRGFRDTLLVDEHVLQRRIDAARRRGTSDATKGVSRGRDEADDAFWELPLA